MGRHPVEAAPVVRFEEVLGDGLARPPGVDQRGGQSARRGRVSSGGEDGPVPEIDEQRQSF